MHGLNRGVVNRAVDALGAVLSLLAIGEMAPAKPGNGIGSAEGRGTSMSLEMEDASVCKGLIVERLRVRRI